MIFTPSFFTCIFNFLLQRIFKETIIKRQNHVTLLLKPFECAPTGFRLRSKFLSTPRSFVKGLGLSRHPPTQISLRKFPEDPSFFIPQFPLLSTAPPSAPGAQQLCPPAWAPRSGGLPQPLLVQPHSGRRRVDPDSAGRGRALRF